MAARAGSAAPWVVGFTRGMAEAVLLAAIGVAIDALSGLEPGDLAGWAPVGLLALRQLEAIADQIDPAVGRTGGDG